MKGPARELINILNFPFSQEINRKQIELNARNRKWEWEECQVHELLIAPDNVSLFLSLWIFLHKLMLSVSFARFSPSLTLTSSRRKKKCPKSYIWQKGTKSPRPIHSKNCCWCCLVKSCQNLFFLFFSLLSFLFSDKAGKIAFSVRNMFKDTKK